MDICARVGMLCLYVDNEDKALNDVNLYAFISLVNQTLSSRGHLSNISAPSERVWRTPMSCFVLQIYRFCILLIGVE